MDSPMQTRTKRYLRRALLFGVVIGSVIVVGIILLGVQKPVSAPQAPTPLGKTNTTQWFPVVSANPLPTPIPPPPPVPIVARIATEDPVIFITIDDGVWHPEDAKQFITQHHVPTISFLTTHSVSTGIQYFKELQVAGSMIENHTVRHPHLDRLTYTEQKEEICTASEQLHRWFSVKPTMLRAPYGEYNLRTRQAAAACGIKYLVQWNVVLDRGKLEYQFKPGHLRPGDIVLLHFRPELQHDLQVLLQAAQERGLRVANLHDYLP